MKSRFTTIDIVATLTELQSLLGMRVINVYDIDNKTYLFKLSSKETKAMLLMESGIRLHTTDFEWPKSPAPSGFTMKLRKHILNRRLESAAQVGVDRIVDLQFGSGEAAYHVILELYDKGNIVLTDYQYSILNILRPRVEGEDVKFMVRNIYPVEKAKQPESIITSEWLREILMKAKVGDNLRRVLNPHLIYGPALIDHVLLGAGFCDNAKIGKGFNICEDIPRLLAALDEAEKMMISTRSDITMGYIIQKKEKRAGGKDEANDLLVYNEFHPYLFRQHEKLPYIELSSFCKEFEYKVNIVQEEFFQQYGKASDEFFSKLESQKIDMKAVQQEKDALKKLENVKKDHERRIGMLGKVQEEDKHKAELIEMNLGLVDRSILVIQSAIANQISWKEIDSLIQEAQAQGDPVAKTIKKLKLEINHITLLLSDPYFSYDSDNEDDAENVSMLIDIDLDLSAYANAKKYYDQKRHAAKKEQKTLDSSTKAYKSAERKTKQVLKDVAVVTNIKKARKVHWFEKFFWFISSENYLIIGGRDQQQNELIVKRYLRAGDIYVHADLHGASSIVVKNPTGLPVPPKTLNEAGTMAVCYSSAWDAKVVTSAWWVYQDQVSKTAPTGEYLTTGSFMIRGKKNYLPPCHLIMGFGILFKLDEESVTKHKDERRIKTAEDDGSDADALSLVVENNDVDISIHSSGDDSANEEETVLPVNDKQIMEEAHLEMVNDLESSQADEKNDESQKINSESEEEIASNPNDDDENHKFSSAYPDTVVELEHVQGEQFLMRHRSISTTSGISDVSQEVQENTVVFLGDNTPVIVGEAASKSIPAKCSNKISQHKNVNKPPTKQHKTEQLQEKLSLSKRGQKYKLRKMKEKYKDQDDEDRQLALELLQPAGASKEPKNKKGKMKKDGSKPTTSTNKSKQIPSKKLLPDLTHIIAGQDPSENRLLEANLTDTGHSIEPDEAQVSDEEKEKLLTKEDELLLSSLTGIPFPDDVLLYAVPVCGPYNSMINYKYKVKLTPGTGKRGKAAKTAIAMHLHDRNATGRERDLIKSLKDQDVSRNIPGKVKMSAPQLQKLKHR